PAPLLQCSWYCHPSVGALPVGGLFPWACFARRSQRGRCSYTPLWEPCPWAKGLFPWACFARRSQRGRCSYTPLWEPCLWAKGLFPWACFARRSQRGRCSYRPLWEPRPRGEWRAARARSVVLEVRLALLDEGLHALGLVGGGEDRVEHP